MMKAILFSFHHYLSQRKAGFHWIAKSLAEEGYEVLFVTTPLSPFSRLIHEPRWTYTKSSHQNRIEKITEKMSISVYAPLYTPISLTRYRFVNYFSRFFIHLYRSILPRYLISWLDDADLIIFESTAAILLYGSVKKRNPDARIIYRVSDALESLLPHPSVLEYEKEISPEFDLISVPSRFLYNKFAQYHPSLHYHGIEKTLFSEERKKPVFFDKFEKNFVFVGNAYLDDGFIEVAAECFPQYGFHIIGPVNCISKAENVIIYGEMPYYDTIPYLQHADCGLHALRYSNSLASYSDSLKVIQYTWCRLPIIAPLNIPSERSHVYFYQYDDRQSICTAITESLRFDRTTIDRSGIYDWNELTSKILAEVSL